MKIKSIYIDGFRCLNECHIEFSDKITAIVGENDCGKTSLIDCLRIITQGKPIELDDFNYSKNAIDIKIDIENMLFEKKYSKSEEGIINEVPLMATMKREYIDVIKQKINSDDYNIQDENNDNEIRDLGKLLGVTVRANISTEKIRERINELLESSTGDGLELQNAQFPAFNNILLDGKQFENVSSFFKELFLKEKQNSIWQEQLEDGMTLEEFVKQRIDSYSTEISEKINENGMIGKIKLFLPTLTDIRIDPIYQPKDLNIDAKVKFLEGDTEVDFQKKGDGTKRRITMALLELKRDEKILANDATTVYLLDEPDTHLHVRAQMQLLQTLQGFSECGNQVIITTHSPFIMNAIKPSDIRMMYQKDINNTKVKCLSDQKDISSKILQSIGIENLYLFFARLIILVEGETEESFIPNYHLKIFNESIGSRLIKIINVRGIKNIYGFSRGILELHSSNNIFALYDNDATSETTMLINSLAIPDANRFILGSKEFEDSFDSNVIYLSWKKYIETIGKTVPSCWTKENIDRLKAECSKDHTKKFSSEIRAFNAGSGTQMTKPILGNVLAENIQEEELPEVLKKLFTKIRESS